MDITADLATFRIMFPEFDAVADATVQFYLDLYAEQLSPLYWGDCLQEAILYRAAHEVALQQNRQANAQNTDAGFVTTAVGGGAVTQASAGAISVSYSQSSTLTAGSDADIYFYKTEYGQQYLTLKRQCLPYGLVATCLYR